MEDFVKAARVEDIPEGQMKGVEVEGEEILLAHIGGEFFAIGNVCTHFYTNLSDGWLNAEEYWVQCPLHESCFDLRTGEVTDPPADRPVAAYAVRVDGEDVLVGPEL